MLQYLTGIDIPFTPNGSVFLHGVNCMGVMGAGVAKIVRNRLPHAYTQYRQLCNNTVQKDELLGTVQFVKSGKIVIANGFTQLRYGRDGQQYANLAHIVSVVDCCLEYSNVYDLTVYMVKIGCGYGGLVWERVEPLVTQLSDIHQKDVFVCCQ